MGGDGSTDSSSSDLVGGDSNPDSTRSNLVRCKRDGAHRQLLPGIPDCITLAEIATKLPWETFHVLSSVSPTWKQAIRSRAIYDTRVRSCSVERVLLYDCISAVGPVGRIRVFSARGTKVHEIPPIPDLDEKIQYTSKSFGLDGKVYNLVGHNKDTQDEFRAMYKIDMAGQGHWERCASTSIEYWSRLRVLDGKIYVLEGVYNRRIYLYDGEKGFLDTSDIRVGAAKVYDPKLDVWSSIEPTPSLQRQWHLEDDGRSQRSILL